jgi:hypothetical protein
MDYNPDKIEKIADILLEYAENIDLDDFNLEDSSLRYVEDKFDNVELPKVNYDADTDEEVERQEDLVDKFKIDIKTAQDIIYHDIIRPFLMEWDEFKLNLDRAIERKIKELKQ